MEIRDKVQKDFVLVHKKRLTKHGGQVVKQVSKPKRILEHIASLEPIIHEISQHNGIESHLFYLNLQHCNASLSFNKIQLAIVKCLQSISLISNIPLKSNPYQFMWNMFRYTCFHPRNSRSFKPFQ